MRVFLVYPTYVCSLLSSVAVPLIHIFRFAVYPHIVPTVQLFDALHRSKTQLLQKKRLRIFWITFVAIFVWEWFPEYIAP
jgi:hypothetical protein